ncbi:periplasmic heavy metal sensor [Devosia sp. FKR38]|uniref:periplasmic heavy metal sensor n=1 Tax=Devosia sp. FKR38 TaxID=2562312 RepID=UPI001484E7A0|nr:periplasmic heavy metal sensor [Devosia sp. FKR38]
MSRIRILAIVLMLSLVGNAFAIGLGLTLSSRTPAVIRLIEPVPAELAERVAAMLPAPAADELRARLTAMEGVIADHRARYRQVLVDVALVLGTETVDVDALTETITAARKERAAIGDQLTQAFAQTAATLPLETRRRLVERFLAQQ